MFIDNVADHGLNNIFERHQAVGSAIFVDHQGQLHAVRLHRGQEIRGLHGWRYEQDRSNEIGVFQCCGEVDLANRIVGGGVIVIGFLLDGIREVGHDVLYVHKAARVVQCIGIDWHARMAGFAKPFDEFIDRNSVVHGINVSPRNHDVVKADLAQAQDVAQHQPFFGRKCGFLFGLVAQRVFQIVAQGSVGLQADHRFQSVKQAATRGNAGLAVGGDRVAILFGTARVRVLRLVLFRTAWRIILSACFV